MRYYGAKNMRLAAYLISVYNLLVRSKYADIKLPSIQETWKERLTEEDRKEIAENFEAFRLPIFS
ncbi:hypothetical protein COOONC_09918 [Cooperia oncophora]